LNNSCIYIVWRGGNKKKEGSAPLLDAPFPRGEVLRRGPALSHNLPSPARKDCV
jgi:hypothetical protein